MIMRGHRAADRQPRRVQDRAARSCRWSKRSARGGRARSGVMLRLATRDPGFAAAFAALVDARRESRRGRRARRRRRSSRSVRAQGDAALRRLHPALRPPRPRRRPAGGSTAPTAAPRFDGARARAARRARTRRRAHPRLSREAAPAGPRHHRRRRRPPRRALARRSMRPGSTFPAAARPIPRRC